MCKSLAQKLDQGRGQETYDVGKVKSITAYNREIEAHATKTKRETLSSTEPH